MQENKGKKRATETDEEEEGEKRPKQQFDKDYILEPFEGVGSEYMEMSMSYFHFLLSYTIEVCQKSLHLVEKMSKRMCELCFFIVVF